MTGLSQPEGDEVFDLLVQAYDAAGPEQGQALLARLCVLLAHRIGTVAAVREALDQAQQAGSHLQQKD